MSGINRINRIVRVDRRLVVAGLLGGAASACGVALTATSGWLVVRADERPQIMLLLTAVVAVRTFGLGRPVFRYLERLRSHDAALDDLARRRAETYARLVPLTPARLGRRGRADLLTGVVDDLTDVTEAPVRVTVPLLGALAAGVLASVLTAALEPAAGLVLVAMLLACAALVPLGHRLEAASQDEVLQARAEVARVAHLATRHADELRAVGGEVDAAQWLRDAHGTLRRVVVRQARGRGLVTGAVLLVTAAGTVGCALVAAASDVPPPVQALLVLTPVATGEALGVLADAVRALARSRAAERRLDAVLDQAPAVRDADDADAAAGAVLADAGRAPRLELRGVAASWAAGRTHLGPVDLVVEPGEHVALVGANGSGKSTLLAVLARHLDPVQGRYLVDGRDVAELPAAAVRSLVAVVDDEPHVFATTLRENLRLARRPDEPAPDDEELLLALRSAGLGDWVAALTDGLDTRLGTSGHGISGGERTRLAIARALLSERPVLLLDEPGAHLDHPTARAVLADLMSAAAGRTVVLVSHHGTGVDLAGRVVELDRPTTREKVAAHA
ncbi:thiol reductant ABC exporter subunit CydC [Janibacter melonis]|uniref:thiol reductant ABC exporter subunit CydC n=1 Tax=Janibacter melonis TaxID=262209 RepID=UPI002043F3F4|nr:thiol reductant ABC exporter subunit CydC [Janibacter melonis]MCM3556181.1 thiol reductant ABC exporter subunit CydC [Janibacter melonis]